MDYYIYIFITAVVFTFVGYSMKISKFNTELINYTIFATINSLVKEGFLKTEGSGENLKILKANDDKTN